MCECMHLHTQIKSAVSIIQCLNSYFSIIEVVIIAWHALDKRFHKVHILVVRQSHSSLTMGCPKCLEFYKLFAIVHANQYITYPLQHNEK